MSRRNILYAAVAVLLGAALLIWLLRPAPIAVEAATVRRGAFEQTVDEQARTRIRDHYTVTAPLSGEVDRISLREGDDVRAGSPVARLRPALPALLDRRTELELGRRVEAARAAEEVVAARIARAELAVTQAGLEAARSRTLAQRHLVAAAKLESDELQLAMAGRELESAKADAHLARHEVEIAVAALARARDAGRDHPSTDWLLRAPIDGRVLRVQQKSAGNVAVGTPLVELGDPANLEVLVELLTTEAPQVAPGAAVRLGNWGGAAPLSGRVRRVEPWGFTKISALGVEEQRVNVLIDIVSPRNEWQSLGEGYRLDAQIQVYHSDAAVTVPSGALFRVGERWFAYLIDSQHRVRRVPVSIGHRSERTAEVTAGLGDGDRVVVYPGDTLRDGARVVIQQQPGEPD